MDIDIEKIRHEFSEAKDPQVKLENALKLAEYEPETMRPVIQLLEPSVVDAPSAITLKLGEIEFEPLVAYPLFPADFIIGYTNPKILLEFDQTTLILFVDIQYDGEPQANATNILEQIKVNYAPNSVFTDRNEWLKAISEEKVEAHDGERIGEFETKDGQRIAVKSMNFQDNKSYLQRVFLFSLLFIEGAVLPDYSDANWRTIVLQKDDESCQFFGYCSLYRFWSYFNGPDFDLNGPSFRYRIAQFLILPPFQRQGLATKLYDAVMKNARETKSISDLQVEDASLEFDIMCQRANYKLISTNDQTKELLEEYADNQESVVKQLQKITKLSNTAVMQAAEVYYFNEIHDEKSALLKNLIQNRIYEAKFADLEQLEHRELRQTLQKEYEQELNIIQIVLGEKKYEDIFGFEEEEDDDEEEDEDNVEDQLDDFDNLRDAFNEANPSKKQKI